MKWRLVPWLRSFWLDPQREALIREYAAIGAQHRLFLADVALRGRLYSGLHVPGDDSATFVNVGRHELALEIVEACGQNPNTLIALIAKPPQKDEKHG